MAKPTLPLTDTSIRKTKATEKPIKMFDGGGLFLLISPKGGKGWRLKYRYAGKEKLISLGTYPTVTLAEARDKRQDAKKLLAEGIDPSVARKSNQLEFEATQANTFERVATEWHEQQTNLADSTKKLLWRRLEVDVFPSIGKTPISKINPRMVLEGVLRPMEKRGVNELCHRTKSVVSRVFRYGVACGYVERDVTSDLRGALQPIKKTHLASITEPKRVAQLLRSIDEYDGSNVVKFALQLAPLVFVRPGELRHAEWEEIDFESSLWCIPAGKMKMKAPHTVPLSIQSVEILSKIKKLTGHGKYVFPSARSFARPLSDNALNAALRRMEYSKEEMTAHGFRAMARTLLDEELQIRPDFIEHQLAHAVKDPLGRAYNRTTHLAERKKMMQTWADYLDDLKSGAN